MGVVENLERAKAQIEDPADWARCSYTTPEGRHCAVGAFIPQRGRFTWGDNVPWVHKHRKTELQYLAAAIPYHTLSDAHISITAYNDGSTHASVMKLFDRAIANARADEQFEMPTVLAREEDLASAGD